jgi:hypothetical protein
MGRIERKIEEKRLVGLGALGDKLPAPFDQGRQHVHRFDDLGNTIVFKNGLHHPGMVESIEAIETARDRTIRRNAPQRCTHKWARTRVARFGAGLVRALDGEPQMPFADDARVVTLLLQERRHRQLIPLDQRRDIAVKHVGLQPGSPGVASRKNTVAARRADRCARVRIRERHALRGQLVNIGRFDLAALRIQALHIAVAEIVGQDINNIWLSGGDNVRLGVDRPGRAPHR